MTLFEPDRHEPLTATRWSDAEARAAIARIASDAHRACTPEGLWPIHPLDRSPERAEVLKPLYYGAAGVIWALHGLERSGLAEAQRDPLPVLATLLHGHRADALKLTGQPVLGYPLGDAGILLLHWTLQPSEALARELERVIEGNRSHPALGFAWGGAGSMLAALFMLERSGDDRWRTLYLDLLERLWSTWLHDEERGCALWTLDPNGRRDRHIGGLHGAPGIVACMLRGSALLPEARRLELVARARALLLATAIREGPHANWPLVLGDEPLPRFRMLLLQHCWGAPGIVNTLASLPADPETDALFLAAGELIWCAGPLTKLPSLCHGVPSAGYAFLKLFSRTGDERWLARARAFAMHGIEQAERFAEQHGQRKFSLWTGDLGLALFLADCLRGTSQIPLLDVF